jgi:hypothetical protein
MKRIALLLALSGSVILVCGASGFDSGVEEREDLIAQISKYSQAFQVVAPLDYLDASVIPAEILSPALQSNFNGLVVFAELGSAGLLTGFKTLVRGPPKSQTLPLQTTANLFVNERASFARKFSLIARTRLA